VRQCRGQHARAVIVGTSTDVLERALDTCSVLGKLQHDGRLSRWPSTEEEEGREGGRPGWFSNRMDAHRREDECESEEVQGHNDVVLMSAGSSAPRWTRGAVGGWVGGCRAQHRRSFQMGQLELVSKQLLVGALT
jgi:hypothetical protein